MMKIGKEREMEIGSYQFWGNDSNQSWFKNKIAEAVENVQKSHHVWKFQVKSDEVVVN